MQNGEAQDTAAAKPAEEVTKQSFRSKIWKHLESNGIAMFPRPVYNRIPNFKGAADAADKLLELDVFKNANSVRVNPDKPQEPVRIKCLEHKKTLYVPATREQPGYLSRIDPPEGEAEFRKAVSRKGMEDYGKCIAIEDTVSLDVVVMGSVAVSKEGYRIGKGRGYSDLEFGLMMHLNAIKPSTIVITTVHDDQVFNTLPADLFGPHDVPIDIIVTPTQVIETQRMSQRPTGLLWHLLSNRRLEQMPVLAKIRDAEIQAGRPCPLKEVDTDMEERAATRVRRTRRRTRSHHNPHSDAEKDEGNTTEGEQGDGKARRRRTPRRRNSQKSASGKEGDALAKPRKSRKPRPAIDFSVKVSNISPNTRVRDLKHALSERGVKPQIMIWKGFRGFCYLHFIKPNALKGDGDGVTVAVPSMESVLSALKDVCITEGGGEGEAPVTPYAVLVEPAPPRQLPSKADVIVSPTKGEVIVTPKAEIIVTPTNETTTV